MPSCFATIVKQYIIHFFIVYHIGVHTVRLGYQGHIYGGIRGLQPPPKFLISYNLLHYYLYYIYYTYLFYFIIDFVKTTKTITKIKIFDFIDFIEIVC